ncbi:hypothetical protein [Raineyella antarctica]|nr:hypothetical protein [Raineyella antarctica]
MAATLINFTGAVQRRYAAEHDVVDVSSPTATLQGNNIREGVSVMLADAGNQWQVSFNRPVLVVQVIDTSPEAVKARLVSLATDLTLITEDLQRSVGADPKDFITMEAPVENAAVDSFGPTRSGALKGGMAVLLVGGVAGMSLSVAMERLRPHRERRRS